MFASCGCRFHHEHHIKSGIQQDTVRDEILYKYKYDIKNERLIDYYDDIPRSRTNLLSKMEVTKICFLHLSELMSNIEDGIRKYYEQENSKDKTLTLVEGPFKEQIKKDSKEYKKLPKWMRK